MVTIISVSFKSKALLEINHRLVQALNPNTEFKWIVVQNSPAAARADDLAMTDPRFHMICGPELTELESQSFAYGSFHHAKALSLAANYAKSDCLLFIDPDCFILAPNWIERVIDHMRQRQLVFFGTPYHPRTFRSYRRFPNVVCMFLDRRRMQEADCYHLDFAPRAEHRRHRQSVRLAIEHHVRNYWTFLTFFLNREGEPRRAPLTLSDWPLVVRAWLEKRIPQLAVGSYGDTGIRVCEEYRSVLKHDELQVFAPDTRRWAAKAIESILPDRYRTFPRNTGQIRRTADLFLSGVECEQFYWQDQLFAFHVSGTRFGRDPEFRDAVYVKLQAKIEGVLGGLEPGAGT